MTLSRKKLPLDKMLALLLAPAGLTLLFYGFFLQPGVAGFEGGWSWLAAIGGMALGTASAAAGAHLAFGYRHVYNIHYALLIGVVSLAWLRPLPEALSPNPVFQELNRGALLIAGGWALAHLAAAAMQGMKTAAVASWIAFAACLALQRPDGPAWSEWAVKIVLLLSPAAVFFLPEKPEGREHSEPPKSKGAGFGALGFLLLNAAILMAFVPPFLGLVVPLFHIGDQWVVEHFVPNPQDEWPFAMIGLRAVFGVLAPLVPALAVFVWPKFSPSKTLMGGGATALLGVAAVMGQETVEKAFTIGVTGVLVLSMATAALAVRERKRRLPMFFLAYGISATVLLQAGAPPDQPVYRALLLWLPEVVFLGIVWIAAYWFGIRLIRKRSEEGTAAAPPPKAGAPPPPMTPSGPVSPPPHP